MSRQHNLPEKLKDSIFEYVGGEIAMINRGTVDAPTYALAIGDTTTAPAAGSDDYATNCIYITASGASTGGILWTNLGTGTSAAFSAIG